jgi:hypothetical protein
MKSFELVGYWWLPNNPGKTIAGTLKFDPINGGSLDLLGSFQDFPEFGKVFDVDIILGFVDGKKITLYRCYATGSNMSLTAGGPVSLKSSFLVNVVFLGHHFEKNEDVVFKSLSVSYSYLEDWTQITGFQFTLQPDKENHLSQYEVKYKFPDKVEVKIGDTNLSFDYSFRDGGDKIKEFKLVQTTFLKIEPPVACHIDAYFRDFLYHAQNFISLGVGRAVYPLVMKGKNENCKIELEKGRTAYNDIEVFYKAKEFQEPLKKLHPLDMVFFFGDVKDEFEKYLNNWFKKAELILPVYDLYFATLYSSKMYLQHEFLSLVQALEVYHRRVYGGKYVSDENFKDVYAKLVDAIPAETENDFKASLTGKMKYLHEYSLRKRLKKITDDLSGVVGILIKDVGSFIDDIESTRNFLTHYDKSLEAKKRDGKELYMLTEQMKFLLEMCFLLEMGMPIDKVKQLATRNQRYQYLARNA